MDGGEGGTRARRNACHSDETRAREASFSASERFEFLHPAMEGSCCFFNGGEGGIRTLVTR